MARISLLALLAACAWAEVRLPAILTDHMVVQRGVPVHVWGQARAGENVQVSFRGETKTAVADEWGEFHVYLAAGVAGGPFEMRVRGRNEIVLRDILVGEVWVAAGQSNMEWPLRWAANPEAEIALAHRPRIRLFRAMHRVSDYPLDDVYGQGWAECGPEVAADFSAVAYHFARNLQEKVDVPVGLIQLAWGGTPIESWTSLEAIAADASLMPALAEWGAHMREYARSRLLYHQEAKRWEALEKSQRGPVPHRPAGPEGGWKPGSIYNAMVEPATRFAVRGVLWYQGETNTALKRAPLYGALLRTMIGDWRRRWGLGDIPFLLVQLANFGADGESDWPAVREAQRKTLEIANTALVQALDLGERDNIHPGNKREVGRRLALAARARVYGEAVEYSGPLYRRFTVEGGALRIWFDHLSGGLTAKGGALRGFELAGPDGKWAAADARIDGETVVVSSPSVRDPRGVRYGWANWTDANLFNATGFPASPFTAPGL